MIYCDEWILEFMKYNSVTVMALIGLLKGLAVLSPNTVDDSIVELLRGFVGMFKKK